MFFTSCTQFDSSSSVSIDLCEDLDGYFSNFSGGEFRKGFGLARSQYIENSSSDFSEEFYDAYNEVLEEVTAFTNKRNYYLSSSFADRVGDELAGEVLNLHDYVQGPAMELGSKDEILLSLQQYRQSLDLSHICAEAQNKFDFMFGTYLEIINLTGNDFFLDATNADGIEVRTCGDILEVLGCFLAQAVSIILVMVLILFLCTLVPVGCVFAGTVVGPGTMALATGFLFFGGQLTGDFPNIYNICCENWVESLEDCEEPEGLLILNVGCNNHDAVISNPTGKLFNTDWYTENLDISDAIISNLSIRNFSVIDQEQVSIISFETNCLDDSWWGNPAFYEDEIQLIIEPPTGGVETIIWGIAPPSTVDVGNSYEIAVSYPSLPYTNLSWSSTFGASITAVDGVFAELDVWNPGEITVTATITNECDNSSNSIFKTITAN